jgi:hypothetical protein
VAVAEVVAGPVAADSRTKTTVKPRANPASLAGNLHLFVADAIFKGDPVARITFQKRQKEMKRLEKQRNNAERREQRKLEKRAMAEASALESPSADTSQAQAESSVEDQKQDS